MTNLLPKLSAIMGVSFVASSFIRLIFEPSSNYFIGYIQILVLSIILYFSLKFLLEKKDFKEQSSLIITILAALMTYIAIKFNSAILGMILIMTLIGTALIYILSFYFFTENESD